jgi:hypothetical protein
MTAILWSMERTPATLAGDADRERALTVLRDATVSGHLTLEEFADRVERTELARTHADLEAVTADLPARPGEADVPVRHRAVFSRLQRAGRWSLAPRSRVTSVGGTIVLDLRRATLHGADTVVDVRNYFGTITLLVPRGVHVEVDGGGAFETREIDLPDSGPVVDAPRLRLRTSGAFGTTRIKTAD